MYEEERRFSIRGVVVTILLIILIVCLLLWIFSKNRNNSNNTNNPVEVTNRTTQIDTNARILENAAKAYYYRAVVPKKVGNAEQVTLKTLINKQMLNNLYGKDGQECDQNTSYAVITRINDNAFDLQSHLRCGNEERNLKTTMYCSDTETKCAVKTEEISQAQPVEEPTPTPTPTPEPVEEKATYKYLYVCETTKKEYGTWSSWSTKKVSSSKTREVQTKKETETRYVKIGTRQEEVITYVTQTVIETHIEEQRYINTKPSNAKSCYSIPKSDYTIYVCQVEVKREVQKQVPVVTYKTVDVYGYKDFTTVYYRYRSVKEIVEKTEKWSKKKNDEELLAKGCLVKKAVKITK